MCSSGASWRGSLGPASLQREPDAVAPGRVVDAEPLAGGDAGHPGDLAARDDDRHGRGRRSRGTLPVGEQVLQRAAAAEAERAHAVAGAPRPDLEPGAERVGVEQPPSPSPASQTSAPAAVGDAARAPAAPRRPAARRRPWSNRSRPYSTTARRPPPRSSACVPPRAPRREDLVHARADRAAARRGRRAPAPRAARAPAAARPAARRPAARPPRRRPRRAPRPRRAAARACAARSPRPPGAARAAPAAARGARGCARTPARRSSGPRATAGRARGSTRRSPRACSSSSGRTSRPSRSGIPSSARRPGEAARR